MPDSLWTRFRFLGDSGSGTWTTPLLVPSSSEWLEEVVLLVELGVVEQRYQAVLEVLAGASVTEVTRRYGVARPTVHTWLGRYGSDGLDTDLGDIIEVEFSDGSKSLFGVEARTTYQKDELPVDTIFAKGGSPVLTLITCGGGFSESSGSYDSNVVVYAVPIPDRDLSSVR